MHKDKDVQYIHSPSMSVFCLLFDRHSVSCPATYDSCITLNNMTIPPPWRNSIYINTCVYVHVYSTQVHNFQFINVHTHIVITHKQIHTRISIYTQHTDTQSVCCVCERGVHVQYLLLSNKNPTFTACEVSDYYMY